VRARKRLGDLLREFDRRGWQMVS